MSSDNLSITTYDGRYEQEWDEFVQEQSVNGTFLQTRRFLNYHLADRFTDASYMVRNDKGEIVAVCPACLRIEDGHKILYSHMGSTYGGIVVRNEWYKTHRVLSILECLEQKWKNDGIDRVILKQTPNLFAKENQDLLEYCLYYLGYTAYKELNLYVDFDGYDKDIVYEFSHGKRGSVYTCERKGCIWRKIDSEEEIRQFHGLLSLTLEKYEKKPVHTPEELYDFITDRLKEECEIYGIYIGDEMVAGAMMFYFHKAGVAHTQYLCADPQYNKLSPMTYTYYAMLCEMRKRGFQKVSWGIVTEDLGRYLNDGLVDSKEAFGSRHGVNVAYEKKIGI